MKTHNFLTKGPVSLVSQEGQTYGGVRQILEGVEFVVYLDKDPMHLRRVVVYSDNPLEFGKVLSQLGQALTEKYGPSNNQ